MEQPLTTFQSHVAGRNAQVAIWPDRIEWSKPGRTMVANVLLVILAVYTIGLTLLASACRPRFKQQGRQMLAMRAVQSVASRRDGLHAAVAVVAGATTIDFRVPHVTTTDRWRVEPPYPGTSAQLPAIVGGVCQV